MHDIDASENKENPGVGLGSVIGMITVYLISAAVSLGIIWFLARTLGWVD